MTPDAAVTALCEMLAFSDPLAPYAGVAQVRAAPLQRVDEPHGLPIEGRVRFRRRGAEVRLQRHVAELRVPLELRGDALRLFERALERLAGFLREPREDEADAREADGDPADLLAPRRRDRDDDPTEGGEGEEHRHRVHEQRMRRQSEERIHADEPPVGSGTIVPDAGYSARQRVVKIRL